MPLTTLSPMSLFRIALLCSALLSGCAQRRAETWPVREAAFSIVPESADAGFDRLAMLWGRGWSGALEEKVPPGTAGAAGLHGAIPVNRYAWTDGGIRFVPLADGWACLSFGPALPTETDRHVFRGAVALRALCVQGIAATNVSFGMRSGTAPTGWTWQGKPGRFEADESGRQPSDTVAHIPESSRLEQRLWLAAGQPVTLRFSARALDPAGFRDVRPPSCGSAAAYSALRFFRRGVNLGNHLEAPPDEDWGARYDPADFEAIRAQGFDHVRLPVAWHHGMGEGPGHAIARERFERADALVRMAAEHDLAVILNWHHFDAFTADPISQGRRFESGWMQIARRYVRFPGRIAFELLNEPRDAADTFAMNAVYARVIPIIREHAPETTLFVGPGQWNSALELPYLRLPRNDGNLVATVHHYEPFLFTHQGAEWTRPLTATSGLRFPGPGPEPLLPVSETAQAADWTWVWFRAYSDLPKPLNPCGSEGLDYPLRLARAWSERTGRPVHVGEWGCIALAEPASRARYHRAMRERLDAWDLPWALWDWKSHFRYWNPERNEPEPYLRPALFPAKPLPPFE